MVPPPKPVPTVDYREIVRHGTLRAIQHSTVARSHRASSVATMSTLHGDESPNTWNQKLDLTVPPRSARPNTRATSAPQRKRKAPSVSASTAFEVARNDNTLPSSKKRKPMLESHDFPVSDIAYEGEEANEGEVLPLQGFAEDSLKANNAPINGLVECEAASKPSIEQVNAQNSEDDTSEDNIVVQSNFRPTESPTTQNSTAEASAISVPMKDYAKLATDLLDSVDAIASSRPTPPEKTVGSNKASDDSELSKVQRQFGLSSEKKAELPPIIERSGTPIAYNRRSRRAPKPRKLHDE